LEQTPTRLVDNNFLLLAYYNRCVGAIGHDEKIRKKERNRDEKLNQRYTNYLQEMRIESEILVGILTPRFLRRVNSL
jgi:hypothetical protein